MSEGIAGKSWRAAVPTRQEYRSNRGKSLPCTVSRVSRKFTQHQQRASLCSGERASAVYHKKSRNFAFIYVRDVEGDLIMHSFASYFEKFFLRHRTTTSTMSLDARRQARTQRDVVGSNACHLIADWCADSRTLRKPSSGPAPRAAADTCLKRVG